MNPEQISIFKNSMDTLGKTVTKKEFMDAFTAVLKIVKDVKDTNTQEWSQIHQAITNLSDKLQKDTSNDLAEIKSQVNHAFVKDRIDDLKDATTTTMRASVSRIDQKLKEIDAKMKTIKNGKDGKDGKDGRDGRDGKNGKDGKDGAKGERGATVVPRSSNSTRFYDLSSKTDGNTKIFSVPKGLSAVLFSSDFPMVLMEGNGFTLNATRTQLTMTTTTAPSAGSQLLYQYVSQFNLAV